jgi:hypothetical protein
VTLKYSYPAHYPIDTQVKRPHQQTHDKAHQQRSRGKVHDLFAFWPAHAFQFVDTLDKERHNPSTPALRLNYIFAWLCHDLYLTSLNQSEQAPKRTTRTSASFPVHSVAVAEAAKLLQLNAVRVVLLVFRRRVVPLFAVCTSERDNDAHPGAPPLKGQHHK